MAFEELKTDEKLEVAVPAKKGMDDLMLAGCTAFGIAAVASYLLCAWSFLLFQDTHRIESFALSALIGPLPALLASFWVGRRLDLAGVCGWIAGMMSASLFLFLRLQGMFRDAYAGVGPMPEYGDFAVWLAPLILLLAVGLAAGGTFAYRSKSQR